MNRQSIERRSNAGRELSLELRVSRSMREMSEPGLSGANFFCRVNSFADAQMSRVRRPKERIEYQDIDAPESSHSSFW